MTPAVPRLLLLLGLAAALPGLAGLASASERQHAGHVVRNEGREAHRGDFSFVVTGGKPSVLDPESAARAEFRASLLRELDAAMQADAETMHERHEFTIHQLERWSKRGVMPVRVKVYLHAKLYGRTTGPTLVDILNRQSLKAKSPVMQGEILRTVDTEHLFQMDQDGAYCREGYEYEGNLMACCPKVRYKHACDCPAGETASLFVDLDDAGCTLGRSCGACADGFSAGRAAGAAARGGGARARVPAAGGWAPRPDAVEGEVVAFSAAGLVGLGVIYCRCRAMRRAQRSLGHRYGRLARSEEEARP